MIKEKLQNVFYENDIIIESDVFEYGYQIFLMYFKIALLLIPISLFFNIYLELLIYFTFFIPLRRVLGGFHFNSDVKCFLFSLFTFFIIPLLSKSIHFNFIWFIVILFFNYLIVIFIGTVDNKKKKLSKEELKEYSIKSNLIIFIYTLILSFAFYIDSQVIISIGLITMSQCSFGAIIGHFQKKLDN